MSSILHTIACGLAVAVLLAAPGPQAPVFRAATQAVPLYVSVADRTGRPVAGLTKDDFVVLDNEIPRPITVFSSASEPVTAVLLLDMGVSMDIALWLQAAGETFVAALRPGDRARIGTFGREIAISPLLTSDKGYLLYVLHEELWPSHMSPLWIAIDQGMSSLARETGRRAVIAFTNGTDPEDWPRSVTDRDLERRAEREGFVLYAVTPRDWPFSRRVKALTESTGGRTARPAGIAETGAALGGIVDELHAQYALAFLPGELDGKVHDIEVIVKYRGLDVRSRRKYLAEAGK